MARIYRPLLIVMMLSLSALMPGTYASDGVEDARSLADAGCRAKGIQAPLVLVFTRSDCAFCKALKKQVVAPLALMYQKKKAIAIFREVTTDLSLTINDFKGKPQPALAIAEHYEVEFYPTVIIVDEHGKQLTKSIVGFSGSEFASYYLEQSIESARQHLSAAE